MHTIIQAFMHNFIDNFGGLFQGKIEHFQNQIIISKLYSLIFACIL